MILGGGGGNSGDDKNDNIAGSVNGGENISVGGVG